MRRCKMTREQAMTILKNFEATKGTLDARREKPIPVYGQCDTELLIEHRNVPVPLLDLFVDGWVAGKRGEIPSGVLRGVSKKPAWRYGYDLARQRRHYFSQALHSFLISEHAEWGHAHSSTHQSS